MEQKRELIYSNYTHEELYGIEYLATEKGTYVAHIRGEWCYTIDDFYREVSSAMRFPWYFGFNWDAFDECLTDLDWLKATSLLIVIDNFKLVFLGEKTPQKSRETLIKFLNIAIEDWESENVPISIYLNQCEKEQKKGMSEILSRKLRRRGLFAGCKMV